MVRVGGGPHGVLALRHNAALRLLNNFADDVARWTQLSTCDDWHDWRPIAIGGLHRAFVRRECPLTAEHLCRARNDPRIGAAFFFGMFWNSARNDVFQIVERVVTEFNHVQGSLGTSVKAQTWGRAISAQEFTSVFSNGGGKVVMIRAPKLSGRDLLPLVGRW